jgi:hypothetical protein
MRPLKSGEVRGFLPVNPDCLNPPRRVNTPLQRVEIVAGSTLQRSPAATSTADRRILMAGYRADG